LLCYILQAFTENALSSGGAIDAATALTGECKASGVCLDKAVS